ncbi:TPA: hypothetical protein OQV24_004400 [Shigella flexneri]|nr:hypothetical protein [Shigella flexneri]
MFVLNSLGPINNTVNIHITTDRITVVFFCNLFLYLNASIPTINSGSRQAKNQNGKFKNDDEIFDIGNVVIVITNKKNMLRLNVKVFIT